MSSSLDVEVNPELTITNIIESSPQPSEPITSFTEEMLTRLCSNSLKLIHRMIHHHKICLKPNSALLLSLRTYLYFILQYHGFTLKDGYKNNLSSTSSSASPSSFSSFTNSNSTTNNYMTNTNTNTTSIKPPLFLSSLSPDNSNYFLSKESSSKDISDIIEDQFQTHYDLKMICEILLQYCKTNLTDLFTIFDLIPILCTPTTLDVSFIVHYFKIELPTLLTSIEKKKILKIFLSFIEQTNISVEVQVKSLQVR